MSTYVNARHFDFDLTRCSEQHNVCVDHTGHLLAPIAAPLSPMPIDSIHDAYDITRVNKENGIVNQMSSCECEEHRALRR